VRQVIEIIRQKAATARYLMQNKPWDCMMMMFGESDGAGHHFWKYCDPRSPLFTSSPPNMQDSIFRVYEELDKQLGQFKDMLPEDTTLLMMSDHGFGGVSNCVLHPNCFLHEQGLLHFRGAASRWYSRFLDGLKLRAVVFLPSKLKRLLYRVAGSRLGTIESRVRFGMIDWPKTVAYFEENPYYPALRINLKGRQPEGTVEPGREYEEVRTRIIESLESWRHPRTGEKIVRRAYRREEVYSGPALEEAPDVVIHWAEHEGYTYAFKLSSKSEDLAWTRYVDPNKPENLAYFTGKSGSHRDNGIFLAQGPGVAEGVEIEGARIMDVAPTILQLLNVPVPDDMDGRPLQQIFTEEYAASGVGAVAAVAAGQYGETASSEAGVYSAEDNEKISQRLRALGYID
jgi:predicted AlkP superfamily phosphohydrolase/phosphomutase